MSSAQDEGFVDRSLPGPVGPELVETINRYNDDPLSESLRLYSKYGDVVAVRRGPFLTVFLFHPDHAHHVLVSKGGIYSRRTTTANRLSSAIGKGLITADKPAWTRLKKLTQPAFTTKALRTWAPVVDDAARRLVERWKTRNSSTPLNVHTEFGISLLEIVGKMLLGESLDEEAAHVIRTATGIAASLAQDVPQANLVTRSAEGSSESANRTYKERYREFSASQDAMNAVLDQQIAKRRANPNQGDLLSVLIDARDEDGNGFSDQEVREQIKTLVIAGHDTTMMALSATFYCLARNPRALALVREELARLRGNEPLDLDTLKELRYTGAVILETLRLYPPVPYLERRAEEEDVVSGFSIPKNATVALSPFVVQRRADIWPEPEAFQPERFLDKVPNHFFPFGMGPRTCSGKDLALMEIKMFLFHILPQFDIAPVEDFELKVVSAFTMHPAEESLPLWVTPR